jgi:phage shock protein A
MGIVERTSNLLAANVNDLIDRLEQPDKLLRQALRELDTQVSNLQQAFARSVAAERLLEKQRDECAAQIDRWNQLAAAAALRDDDALARRALGQRLDAAHVLEQAREQCAEAQRRNDVLRGRFDTLRRARMDARRRLAAWSARASSSAAQRQLYAAVSGDCQAGVLAQIERLGERLEFAEAEALALGELAAAAGDALAREFVDRQRSDAIEIELQRLKSRRTS